MKHSGKKRWEGSGIWAKRRDRRAKTMQPDNIEWSSQETEAQNPANQGRLCSSGQRKANGKDKERREIKKKPKQYMTRIE